jgi:hypothetical protein
VNFIFLILNPSVKSPIVVLARSWKTCIVSSNRKNKERQRIKIFTGYNQGGVACRLADIGRTSTLEASFGTAVHRMRLTTDAMKVKPIS